MRKPLRAYQGQQVLLSKIQGTFDGETVALLLCKNSPSSDADENKVTYLGYEQKFLP